MRGRPRTEIDVEQLEKLCGMNCTDEEIAAWFKVSVRTIIRRKKSPKFLEIMQRGKALGRISIRREQIKLMQNGSVAMAIFLGKNMLGQKDNPLDTGNGGDDGALKELADAIRNSPQ